eukprot:259283-Chlamydomonas_euryale.AAC.1
MCGGVPYVLGVWRGCVEGFSMCWVCEGGDVWRGSVCVGCVEEGMCLSTTRVVDTSLETCMQGPAGTHVRICVFVCARGSVCLCVLDGRCVRVCPRVGALCVERVRGVIPFSWKSVGLFRLAVPQYWLATRLERGPRQCRILFDRKRL